MICTPKVRQLLEVHFFMGKKGNKRKRYSAEFKMSVIMEMRKNYLSHRETVRKFFDAQNRAEEDNYLHTLRN